MNDDVKFGDFTRGEQAAITGLIARMALPRADIRKLQRKVERIENQARRRKNKQ
ncbi:DUF6257 family protein [Streptomyces sp. NPDC096094]|uniref:DUF6257 family protein n=1 Tax=Streptomyces sp. NPDC096094 TaxID=3366073 RepID=UPI00382F8AA2